MKRSKYTYRTCVVKHNGEENDKLHLICYRVKQDPETGVILKIMSEDYAQSLPRVMQNLEKALLTAACENKEFEQDGILAPSEIFTGFNCVNS